MALNDIYKASAIFDVGAADGDVVVTHHYRLDNISTALSEPGFCGELASELRLAYETDYLPNIASAFTLDRVDVYNVTQPIYSGTFASGTAGGDTVSDPMAIRNAVVVARKTGLRGRSYNGRMFLPGVVEADQSAGVIFAAFKAQVQVFADGIIDLLTGNNNRYQGVVYSEKLAVGTDITAMLVRDVLGSQRGRQKVT